MATSLQLNPTVTDPFPTKTLQQLRIMVMDALGFEQPQGSDVNTTGFRTLGDLTAAVRTSLGLAQSVPVVPDTLGNIRQSLYNLLGMGAMTIHPPGVDNLLTTFINNAQQIIYRALEVDAGGIAQDLGPETVTGNLNNNSSGWQLGDEWAYVAPALINSNAGEHSLAQQVVPVVAGQTYLVQWQQQQSIAYNPSSNTGGQGIIATLGGVQAAPILLQNTAAGVVSVSITANATGGVILSFQNATGSPLLPGWAPSGTVSIASVSCRAMGQGTVLGTQPPPMLVTGTSDSTFTKLDATAILNLATALAKTHYGQPDGKNYFEWYQKWLKDLEGRGPPNINSLIINQLQEAQREIARTYEVGYAIGSIPVVGSFSAATDNVSMDAWAVYKLATAKVKAMTKANDAEMAMKEYLKYLSDLNERMPTNAPALINRLLKQAQDFLFRTYQVFRMERWFTWTLVAGQRFYGTNLDDSSAIKPPSTVTAALGNPTTVQALTSGRSSTVSILLQDGTVLITGGQDALGGSAACDIFDYRTNQVTATASMSTPRVNHLLVLLTNGEVLAINGNDSSNGLQYQSAEIYDPVSKTWSDAAIPLEPRGSDGVAITLQTGKVLLFGGLRPDGTPCGTELYDPNGNAWTYTGQMVQPRTNTKGVLLNNGVVLAAGGIDATTFVVINTTELYNPITGQWTAGGLMQSPRFRHTVTLLRDGTALIAGGQSTTNPTSHTATAEIYSGSNNTTSPTVGNLTTNTFQDSVAVLLANGTVFIESGSTNVANIYTPSASTFAGVAGVPSQFHYSAILLPNGLLGIFGGLITATPQSTVAFYNPAGGTFTTNGSLTQGSPLYRVAAYDDAGMTLASLPEVQINGVPANTSVILSWVPVTNASITGFNIFGRTKSDTTTTGTFVIPAIGGSVVISVASAAGFIVGLNALIFDGTNLIEGVVTAKAATITLRVIQIATGSAGAVMANGAVARQELETLIASVGPTVTQYEDMGTIVGTTNLPQANASVSTFGLDPREIAWVGASCNQNTWRELKEGIPAQIYNAQISGPPAYYEIRQAIELWPSPPDSTWQLQIKGYFSPLPFDTDQQVCWIDYNAIYLYTVAKAKALYPKRFNRADVAESEAAWKAYIKQLVAGTHKTARYVPGTPRYRPVRPLPVMAPTS